MHHPRKLLIFALELNGTATNPYSRPPGRRILYATRTVFLILSVETTVRSCSEYSITASVFSSCPGKGRLTSACIHWGASPHTAGAANPSRHTAIPNRTGAICRLVDTDRRTWL